MPWRRTLGGVWVRVGQTGYGLYPCSLLRRKIIFSSHLQLLSTSAKIELRATVEPQGARSVPQIRRIAATHEESAFFLPWNRIAAIASAPSAALCTAWSPIVGYGVGKVPGADALRSDQPPPLAKENRPDIYAGEPRLSTASMMQVSAVSQQYHGLSVGKVRKRSAKRPLRLGNFRRP